MKTADITVLIWLIVGVLMFVAKGWTKLQGQIDDDESEAKRPAAARPRPQRPRPMTQPTPMRPPRATPAMPRVTPQSARMGQRTAPAPVGTPTWRVDPEQMRRFIEQLSGKPPEPEQPRPQATPPPIQRTEPPAPSFAPEPASAMAAAVAEPVTTNAPVPAPATTSRASQWAEALRDHQNIRNIVISAEIIGPPLALRKMPPSSL